MLFNKTPSDLVHLQRALHFRTVSVAADEPLCIATLMGLDTRRVAAPASHQDRMVRVWEQLARLPGDDNGDGNVAQGIPVRLIFFLEEPLDVPGWRWAPRTLLGSSVHDPVLGIDERVVRFVREDGPDALGTPTPLGLRVRLCGCRLVPRPRAPGLPLDPWPELVRKYEDQVLLQRDDGSGSSNDGNNSDRDSSNAGGGGARWVRIMDWYRSRKIGSWTREQRLEHDTRVGHPLQRAIATGRCAIVYDPQSSPLGPEVRTCCLLQADEMDDAELAAMSSLTTTTDATDANMSSTNTDTTTAGDDAGASSPRPLKARRERAVIMSPLSDAEARMMDVLQGLADKAAADPATRELLALGPPPPPPPPQSPAGEKQKGKDDDKSPVKLGDGGEGKGEGEGEGEDKGQESPWKAASTRVRDLLKKLVADALVQHPEVVQTARDYIGPDIDEYLWVLIPKVLSHATVMREVPEGQVWYVD